MSHTPENASPNSFAASIDAYRPQMPAQYWAQIETFVRDTVLQASPATFEQTRRLLIFVSHFALWCWGTAGLGLDAAQILVPSVVDAYVTSSDRPVALAQRQRERNALHRLCQCINPSVAPVLRTSKVHASIPEAPYSLGQIVSLRNWASGQRLPRTRINMRAMLALGAGAGLHPSEIVQLPAKAVEFTPVGTTIHVTGKNARSVPLLAKWEDFLKPTTTGDEFLISSASVTRSTTILKNFIASSSGFGLSVSPQRLRVTWMVSHLNAATPLSVLLDAAGLTSPFSLNRYLPYVDAFSSTTANAALRQAAGTNA